MINAQLENVSRRLSTGWAWFTSCLIEREWMTLRKKINIYFSFCGQHLADPVKTVL